MVELCLSENGIFLVTLLHDDKLTLYYVDIQGRAPQRKAQSLWTLESPTRTWRRALGVTCKGSWAEQVRVWVATNEGSLEVYNHRVTRSGGVVEAAEPPTLLTGLERNDTDDSGRSIKQMWKLGSDLFCISMDYYDDPGLSLSLYDGKLNKIQHLMSLYSEEDRFACVVPGFSTEFYILVMRDLTSAMRELQLAFRRGHMDQSAMDRMRRPHSMCVWVVEWGEYQGAWLSH